MTSLHLAVASLHVVLGHLGSSLIYRLRFGRSPLVVYRAPASPHRAWSRLAGAAAAAWAVTFVASVASPWWTSHPLGRPLFAVSPMLSWPLALVGLVLMCAAQIAMGAAFRIGQDPRDAPLALAVDGLHSRTRNPIYMGSWLALAGMTLWHPSVVLVVACLVAGVAMHALVLAEERFLRARFGPAFEAYCARTPRWGFRPW